MDKYEYQINLLKTYIVDADNLISPLEAEFQFLKLGNLHVQYEDNSSEDCLNSTTKNFWCRVHQFYFRDAPLYTWYIEKCEDVYDFISTLSNGTLDNKKLCLEYFKITHRSMELFCDAYEFDRGYSPIKLAQERFKIRERLKNLEQTIVVEENNLM